MTTTELQDILENAIESLIEAQEEIDGDDDDIALAEITRDLVSDFIDQEDGITMVQTFGRAQLLGGGEGLVLRMADGAEFQISIVLSRAGRDE